MKRSIALTALGAVAALTLAGCGFGGIYDVPLPGGADLGDHPYTVKAQFQDVLDLVPKSGVKVNEVAVGRVESIGLTPDGWHAEVTMEINGDVKLPANALANIRQSSLLGEKYVELTSPGDDLAQGALANNAEIPLARTNRSVDVEEVLGALSMLLNGGGVEQINTITKELNSATEGREPDIRNLLNNANQLVTTLDKQSADITRALDGLNRLSSTLVTQKDQLANAIDNLGPGLGVLEQQRTQLVTMLQALRNLSGVTVDTINKSQEDLVADLRALLPTLQKLGEAGSDLPKSLELLLTFPFTDSAIPGAKGDYFNLYAKVDLNLQTILQNLGRSRDNPLSGILPQNLAGGTSSDGTGVPLPLQIPGTSSSGTSPGTTGSTGNSQQSQSGLAGLFGLLSGGGA
ncbi:phospholipid/cholesterol/gamma-HCH transport system substrate-binding protein [Amycolatopsis bartoniae]|uniref:ABC transporter substrate-binding protein n=1 Tax=Amycolatopsis bartoniae TaxID=941986 RepID=A0A8H9J3J5_9PSEU|nr:MCE family protein [Amycolatopsis bartoniae]MBB2933822.1 phospholipid/cholesterol/gamma-HCH transport system substrate-binding protein [Amycolatopsis bartoniae]TVT10523.1 MCE family protein [Amycolatopsis bartoniae]GHF87656.1 ABC transporter substrate-binding protein [Amycolatopsis bartoniae]